MDITKRFNRVISIFFQLQAKPVVKAQTLADQFDVSLRTIYRDIKSLETAGIPVFNDPGVGYSLIEGYKIPPILFSKEEALSFIAAEKLAEKYFDKDMRIYFEQALLKMKAILRTSDKENLSFLADNVHMSPFTSAFNQNVPAALSILLESIAEETIVSIHYQSSNSTSSSKRSIEPIGIFHENNFWYFMAYCHVRNDYRQFRLDRIQHIAKTAHTYTRKHKNLAHYLNQKEKSLTTAVRIKMHRDHAKHLKWEQNFYGYVSQQEDGEQVTLYFESKNIQHDFARWYVSFADVAEILEPQELKYYVKNLLESSLDRLCNGLK